MALAAGILTLVTLAGLLCDEAHLRRPFSTGQIDLVRPLALIVLWLALLCLRPDAGLRVITASSAAARLLCRLLPPSSPCRWCSAGSLSRDHRLGRYSEGLNIAPFALSNVIVFGFLLFGQVRTVPAAALREKNIEAALRDMQRRERARQGSSRR